MMTGVVQVLDVERERGREERGRRKSKQRN
jgi:hypothetical protein